MPDLVDPARYQTDNRSPWALIQLDCWVSRNLSRRRHNEHVIRDEQRRRRLARLRSLVFFWRRVP